MIRPSYGWLFGSRLLGVYDAYRRHNQPTLFAALGQLVGGQRCDEHATEALNVLTRMSIVTGKGLLTFDLEDFADYAQARRDNGRTVMALPLAYDILHTVGGLKDSPPTLREARARGQLTPAELIDRHPIANRAVRDVLVHYIAERSSVLDYGSLVNHAQTLADLFWGDLQRHHPAISSLDLPDEVAQAWKQRVRVLPDGRPRRTAHAVFLAVRSFYLDLSQWSMEDPARWAAWAAPCPISEADIRGYIKETRHRQGRMQQRTRTLVPVLPRLVRADEARLQRATLLLQAARSATPGDEFTVEGTRYRRTGRNGSNWRPTALFLAPVDEPGPRFDAECEENNAFWTWASIEVLRRTGARIEELLELTHLSLRQYQAPTGETVPLLQISPSKTDRERVIPADPDLVAVLARIIRRVKGTGDRVPLLTRYDGYERVFGPPMPHLFQCPSQHRLQVISPNRIRELLTDHALRAGTVDVDGTPLTFTPHDFRRIFSTETVNGGLPIHIAAKLLGHLELNTTQAYVAVHPEEVIRHYRQFVDQAGPTAPARSTASPATPSGRTSATTSASARSPSAPATGLMGPLASMKTPVSGAPCSASTWPRNPDCWRSRPTPASASGRPSGCSGSAKSPACRRACDTSPTRNGRPNACEPKPVTGKPALEHSVEVPAQRHHANCGHVRPMPRAWDLIPGRGERPLTGTSTLLMRTRWVTCRDGKDCYLPGNEPPQRLATRRGSAGPPTSARRGDPAADALCPCPGRRVLRVGKRVPLRGRVEGANAGASAASVLAHHS
ncbi:tyrosine-type recombinase/integrase [Streptomyces sp. NPDC049602]|uniref:tyrosine-type recombinase/integrase n=1 Tax=Streptomyces sp. NPDC049602 TaxID=3155504 RepID=UPI0034275D05